MNRKLSPALSAALAVALACPLAHATTSCSFSTVIGVTFGGYNVFSTSALDSTGSLTFSCQGVGAMDAVIVDLSRGSSGSYVSRTMLHGTTGLSYNLFLDAARSAVWGDGTDGTSHYGPVAPVSGSNVTVAIYGRVAARQNVSAGSYGDTLVVTIQF